MKDIRCADCGFLQTASVAGKLVPPSRPTRETHQGPAYFGCFRQVADFDRDAVRAGRDCLEFMEWEPGLNAKEHFDVKEIRLEQKRLTKRAGRDRLITLAVGLATILSVVGMGLLNYFG